MEAWRAYMVHGKYNKPENEYAKAKNKIIHSIDNCQDEYNKMLQDPHNRDADGFYVLRLKSGIDNLVGSDGFVYA